MKLAIFICVSQSNVQYPKMTTTLSTLILCVGKVQGSGQLISALRGMIGAAWCGLEGPVSSLTDWYPDTSGFWGN